ncbi:MAG: hypothetical protein RLZ83_210 [Pseudomonadota bacterium]
MTSSERSAHPLDDPGEPSRPQWWPDVMLARSPATDPLPFRPSVWSGRQEPGFHALQVRRERPLGASTTQDPTRPAVFSEELGGDVTQDWPDGATAVPAPTAEPAVPQPVTRAQSEATAPVQAAPRAATAGSNVPARTTEGGATIEAPTTQALQEAYARGVEDGQARARARDEAARQRQEALLKLLFDQLDRNAVRPADWSTPMKRLCLRLAEEIVRGELQQPRTVERLVEQGLSALGESPQRPVVRLHPDDLTVLSPLLPRFAERCRFEAVPGMRRGSVEVAADDTLMQDLIENRLRALADQLFQDDAGAHNGPAAGA